MHPPEWHTKQALKAFFKERGWYYFMPVQNGMGKMGLDFFVCANGPKGFAEFWAVEAKKPGVVEPTARQLATMREIRASGGRTFCVSLDEQDNLMWREICDGS